MENTHKYFVGSKYNYCGDCNCIKKEDVCLRLLE